MATVLGAEEKEKPNDKTDGTKEPAVVPLTDRLAGFESSTRIVFRNVESHKMRMYRGPPMGSQSTKEYCASLQLLARYN